MPNSLDQDRLAIEVSRILSNHAKLHDDRVNHVMGVQRQQLVYEFARLFDDATNMIIDPKKLASVLAQEH